MNGNEQNLDLVLALRLVRDALHELTFGFTFRNQHHFGANPVVPLVIAQDGGKFGSVVRERVYRDDPMLGVSSFSVQ
nr:hypothetical protein [uncultured bacterium]